MVDLSRLGARSLGVWTRPQSLALLTPGQVDALVRTRQWQVLWRGTYADGGVVVSAEQRAIAAVLCAGGTVRARSTAPPGPMRAVAAGRTAARVWALPLVDDDDPATGAREHLLEDVAVDRHLPCQSYDDRRLVPHQLALRRTDVVTLPSGLLLTSPLRTLTDLARLVPHEALVCAADAALHRRLVTPQALADQVEVRSGREGGPALAAAARVSDGRAEAPSETLARLLLKPVLPGLEPQVRLFDRTARIVARFDLGDPAVCFAVEADGKRRHAGTAMVARDRRRDRTSRALGWTTERVTWFELRREQRPLVRRVVQEHGAHAARRTA